MDVFDFMRFRTARLAMQEDSAPHAEPLRQRGRPALLLAPVPVTGMRYAMKGERPPSKYSPGEQDGVIERYDAYAMARGGGRVKRHG